MKTAARFRLVLVTAPDLKVARGLARTILQARLAACVNLLPGVESHYWWQGALETGREVLLLIKTDQQRLAALERLVRETHPYDTPEFLALPIRAGSARYLDWMAANLGATPSVRRKPRGGQVAAM